MLTFDRAAIRKNRARCDADSLFLCARALRFLSERLDDVKRDFPLALQIGLRGGVMDHAKIGTLVTADLAPTAGQNTPALITDSETLPFAPQSFDLILSIFDLHNINDVPGALIQMRRALKPDGLLLAAFPGGDTLIELRDSIMRAEIEITGGVSPRVFPFIDKQSAGALMQRAQFALPVVDSEKLTVTYAAPLRLLHDLQKMGEGNTIIARNRQTPPRRLFATALSHYQNNFGNDNAPLPATYEVIILTGWAPHSSQQQPLKRGSGQISLADALETPPSDAI